MRLVQKTFTEEFMPLRECSECSGICDTPETEDLFLCQKCLKEMDHSRKARHNSQKLLLKLDQLMRQGQSESSEADSIRNEMELFWKQMSGDDQKLMSVLSEQLYDEWSEDERENL